MPNSFLNNLFIIFAQVIYYNFLDTEFQVIVFVESCLVSEGKICFSIYFIYTKIKEIFNFGCMNLVRTYITYIEQLLSEQL